MCQLLTGKEKWYDLDMQIDLTTEEAKIWKMFLRTHAALMRTMERDIQREHNISLSWYDVLTQLSLAEGKRMTHTKLGERILVNGGGVTRLVDRMAREGLVVRRRSKNDRRTSFVVLTDQGEKALLESTPRVFESVRQNFLQHLRSDELPTINNFFTRVLGEGDSIELTN
jgi:DNA-binding MarR family transcriptional regulator